MACIIKLPNETKGVLSMTSPESREVLNVDIKNYLSENRKDWIYLLHHNWTPEPNDPFFDSNLCNSIDLLNGGHCLDMDCCNFSPSVYYPSQEKTFDVLYVTRCVDFKRLGVFFNTCKKLLARDSDIKILLICSIPEVNCSPSNPKQIYLDTFTKKERKNFLTLFIDYDYPFTISKEFLGHFYRSSKAFLHTATAERHSRVCSYAWASGIPVIGYKNLATFLPSEFQQPPYFYQVSNDEQYVDKIIEAINSKMPYDDIKYIVSEDFATNTFKEKLNSLFKSKGLDFNDNNMYLKNLDFRMGRHCEISLGDNTLPISIPKLMEAAKKEKLDTQIPDLELSLCS